LAIQYAGGVNVNFTWTSDGTKANLQSNIITQLGNAGWTQLTGPTGGGAQTVTISIASPGVLTFGAAHNLNLNDLVVLSTTGALPTGLAANTLYFVKTIPGSTQITLSTSAGGAVINTSGTQSGTHTAVCACRMQSAVTAWGVSAKVLISDIAANCLNFTITNTAYTLTGSQNGNAGAFLLPANTFVFRIVANKYQAFVFRAATTPARGFVAFGTPYVPSFLQTGLTEAAWCGGNAGQDSSSSILTSFRTQLTWYAPSVAQGNSTQLWNTNIVDLGNTSSSQGAPNIFFLTSPAGNNATGQTGYHWADASAHMAEPLIGWATSSGSAEPLIRGELWDAVVIEDTFAGDTTTTFDSHNWIGITDNNGTQKATLFIVTP
jgi:hypothetical protein